MWKLIIDGLVYRNDKVIDYIPVFKLSDKYIYQNLTNQLIMKKNMSVADKAIRILIAIVIALIFYLK